MENTDPTEPHEPADRTQLVDQTQVVAPPAEAGSRNTRPLLLGLIVAFSLGIVGVAVAAAGGFDPGADEGAPLVTETSTAISAQEVAAPSSVTTTDSAVALTTTQAQAVVPPPGQPQQTAQQPTGQVTPQNEPTGPPTIPPGHVDSCAYPNMGTTVVSGTTYTAAPTPTVTAVTSPQQCPPYSAGYPWDRS